MLGGSRREALASLPTALVLDRLFAGAPVGMALFDRDGRFVRVNPALSRMSGRAAEDLLGRGIREAFGADGELLETLVQRVVRTGEPAIGVEMPSAADAASHRLASYAPVVDEDGAPLGVVAVVQDVTARKRAEEELERSLERVTRLQRVTAALSAALTVDAVA